MNRKQLSDAVAEKLGITKDLSDKVVREVFGIIEEEVLNDKPVTIYGFGKFKLVSAKERKMYNPKTETFKDVTIAPRISFKHNKKAN